MTFSFFNSCKIPSLKSAIQSYPVISNLYDCPPWFCRMSMFVLFLFYYESGWVSEYKQSSSYDSCTIPCFRRHL